MMQLTKEQAAEINRETLRYIESVCSVENDAELRRIKKETFRLIENLENSRIVREFMSLVWDDIHEERKAQK